MCVFIFRVETTVCLLNWFGKKKTVRRKATIKVSFFYYVFPNMSI